jgi:entericidin B
MRSLKNRFSLLAVAISLAGILGSIGCNTIHGIGRDIERGGEKTQDAADSVKRRL